MKSLYKILLLTCSLLLISCNGKDTDKKFSLSGTVTKVGQCGSIGNVFETNYICAVKVKMSDDTEMYGPFVGPAMEGMTAWRNCWTEEDGKSYCWTNFQSSPSRYYSKK